MVRKSPALDLLRRLAKPDPHALPSAAGEDISTEDRMNTALGCKTSEVALTLLAQVIQLENPDRSTSEERRQALLMDALAMLAELEPKTAMEALLATQMIGVHRLAMLFLRRAALEGQTPEGVDANVLRASRLMRVFIEQLEAMAKLKGKSGHQRVVVEHVTVNEGGKAIVGAVAATHVVTAGSGAWGEGA